MFKKRLPSRPTKEVVLTSLQPEMLSGQYEAVGLPFQNEPPLALIGPLSGLFDHRRLSTNGESALLPLSADWRCCKGPAEANESRDKVAAKNFMVLVGYCLNKLAIE